MKSESILHNLIGVLVMIAMMAAMLPANPVIAEDNGFAPSFSFITQGDATADWTDQFSHIGDYSVELVWTNGDYAHVLLEVPEDLKVQDVSSWAYWVNATHSAYGPRISFNLDTGLENIAGTNYDTQVIFFENTLAIDNWVTFTSNNSELRYNTYVQNTWDSGRSDKGKWDAAVSLFGEDIIKSIMIGNMHVNSTDTIAAYVDDLSLVIGTETITYEIESLSTLPVYNSSRASYHETIQDAINQASAGDTIEVAAGAYPEQLLINKNLSLVGAPGAIIQAPENLLSYTLPETSNPVTPIVFAFGGILDGTSVSGSATISFNMSGFEVDALGTDVSYTTAVLLRNAEGIIADNIIGNLGLTAPTYGLMVYGDSDLHIKDNQISHFNGSGILANGDLNDPPLPKPNVVIHQNTITTSGINPVNWAADGVQINYGASGAVTENVISGSYWEGDLWAASGILIQGSSDIVISGNTVDLCQAGIAVHGYLDWNGAHLPSDNITITENNILNTTYGVRLQGAVSETNIQANTITENHYGVHSVDYPPESHFSGGGVPTGTTANFNKLNNNTHGIYMAPLNEANQPAPLGYEIDASQNWWGSITGSEPMGSNIIHSPWCGDDACRFFVFKNDQGHLVLDGALHPGGLISVEGGIPITEDNLTVYMTDGTVIQNNSPCFTVTANNVTLLGQSPGSAACFPTGNAAGIEVAENISSLYVINLDFDGTYTSGPAINFAGDVYGLQILNNKFHDFNNSAIVFGGAEKTGHVIQGNLFTNVGTPPIASGSMTIDAAFNSWGVNGAPSIDKVTTTPYTHVNLWVESSGAFSGNQVAKGEKITYTVMADMANITGADVLLDYPQDLLVFDSAIAEPETSYFFGIVDHAEQYTDLLIVNEVTGTIRFRGWAQNQAVSRTLVLFTVTFDASEALTGLDDLLLIELGDGFSMTPNTEHFTNHVFPASLGVGEVAVVERPGISSPDIDHYTLIGEAHTFHITIENPTELNGGGDYPSVLYHFTIEAEEGNITLFQSDSHGSPVDIPLVCENGVCVADVVPDPGFSIDPGYQETRAFQIEFATPGTYPVDITLQDHLAEDIIIAAYQATLSAYEVPTINSVDFGGPYIANLPEEFTLTVTKDANMNSTFEMVFDLPEGTLLAYDGTPYPCQANGCTVPITLTSTSTELTFTVTFAEAFDEQITVRLFSAGWPVDRQLAVKVFGVQAYADLLIEGKVSMQGRYNRGGVMVTLIGDYGSTATSLNQMGANIFFNVAEDVVYTLHTEQERYLNIQEDLQVTVSFSSENSSFDLYLFGGNAHPALVYVPSLGISIDVIDISDASIVGGAYGTGDITSAGDVNFDGRVNIQDLALVGGNYGLTSADAYGGWAP